MLALLLWISSDDAYPYMLKVLLSKSKTSTFCIGGYSFFFSSFKSWQLNLSYQIVPYLIMRSQRYILGLELYLTYAMQGKTGIFSCGHVLMPVPEQNNCNNISETAGCSLKRGGA